MQAAESSFRSERMISEPPILCLFIFLSCVYVYNSAGLCVNVQIVWEPKTFVTQDGVKWADLDSLDQETATLAEKTAGDCFQGDPAFVHSVPTGRMIVPEPEEGERRTEIGSRALPVLPLMSQVLSGCVVLLRYVCLHSHSKVI